MGTCYSKSGHDAAEATDDKKIPYPKDTRSKHPNGTVYLYNPVKERETKSAEATGDELQEKEQDGEEVQKINTIDSGIESLISSHGNNNGLKEQKEAAKASEPSESTTMTSCGCENCKQNDKACKCKFKCLPQLPESNVDWTASLGRQPVRGLEGNNSCLKKTRWVKPDVKYNRLSCKSTDSLDWMRSLATSMDRTQSQVSDVFMDDVSLYAPLAHFDSMELLEDEDEEPSAKIQKKGSGKSVTIKDQRTKIEMLRSGNTRELNIQEIKKQLSTQSLLGSRDGEFPSLGSSLFCFPARSEVPSMIVDGKEVVLIDADTYTQIMDEIALLKMKLGQLTNVIQEEQLLTGNPVLDYSIMDNST